MISTHLSGYSRLSNRLGYSMDRQPGHADGEGPETGAALGGLLTEKGWTSPSHGLYDDALRALKEARTHSCLNRELEAATDLSPSRWWDRVGPTSH